MELYTRIIDNNLCIAYFSLKNEEAMHIYEEAIKKSEDSLYDADKYFMTSIENDYLDLMLYEYDIVSIGEKDIKIVSDFKCKQPLIGIARFLILPEAIDLSVPMSLPTSVIEETRKKQNRVMEQLKIAMLSSELSFNNDAYVIDYDCIVTYDLRFIINGKIVSSYQNQVLEMYSENQIDITNLVGAKVNDAVIISTVDGVTTDLLIRNIEKKIPFDEVTDLYLFISNGFSNYDDLVNRFTKSYCQYVKINNYVDYCVNFIYQNTDINYNANILDFYKKRRFYAYENKADQVSYEDENEAIKKSYIFDLLLKMAEFKDRILTIDDFQRSEMEYRDATLSIDYNSSNSQIYAYKSHIFRYLKKEKIFS